MVKASLLFLTALLCTACNGSGQPKPTEGKPAYFWLPLCSADSIEAYRQQARQGSGDAFLKLARCYHDGTGVQRDYQTMKAYVELSTETTGITMKEFTSKLSDDDDYRLIYTGIESALVNDDETSWLCLTKLESLGYDSEAEIIRHFRADTTVNRYRAFRNFYRTASKEDCALKRVFACLGAIDAGDYAYATGHLPHLAETSPALWVSLGHLYTQHAAIRNDSIAAIWYAKADSLALLGSVEKQWLEYYRQLNKQK